MGADVVSADLHPAVDAVLRAMPLADETVVAEVAIVVLRWAAGQLNAPISDRHARHFLLYEADEIERQAAEQ